MDEVRMRRGGRMAVAVARVSLHDADDDVRYWLTQPIAARIAAVEVLRRRVYGGAHDGTGSRLQRVHRVVDRP